MSARPLFVVVIAAQLWASPGAAGELWRSADGDEAFVVEAKGFYKGQLTGLMMPAGLVDASAELQRVFDETRVLLPPGAGAALPDNLALPPWAALTTHTLRLDAAARFTDALQLDVAWQISAVAASDARFAAGTSGTSLLGGSQRAPARRLVDFEPVLVHNGGLALVHNLDKAALSWRTAAFNLVIGRQVVSWGSGQLWNPTDLFSPFAPTDVDREVRRGADAVRVSVPLGATTELDGLWLPQQSVIDNGAVLRARTNVLGADISATAAKYVQDIVLGADVSGEVDRFGLYAEAAWTLPIEGLAGPTPSFGEGFVRAVAGVSCRPTEAWYVDAEYYFNGFGSEEVSGVLSALQSDRVTRGEIFGARRHYVGVINAWTLDDLTRVSITTLVNVSDPGVIVLPGLEMTLTQQLLLRAGATLPLGAGIDSAPFHALTPTDVLTPSPAFRDATTTFGARSETGLTPPSLFVLLGAYFG